MLTLFRGTLACLSADTTCGGILLLSEAIKVTGWQASSKISPKGPVIKFENFAMCQV